PARTHVRLPLVRIEHADRQPAGHCHRIGLFQERFEVVDRHGKAEIGGHRRLQCDDAVHAPLHIHHRPAAIPPLPRPGQLAAEATPDTTLCCKPRGLPSATTAAPCFNLLESPSSSAGRSLASIRTSARSSDRSVAWTVVTSCFLPSAICTVIGRPSPMTCRLV